jgi:hypothetical protein
VEPWGHHREFSYVERGFYGEQLERLYELFPRAQVLVLQASELSAAPGPVIAKVRQFLDLPPGPEPAPRRVHVAREMDYGGSLTDEDAGFLRAIYATDQARLTALTDAGSIG